MVFDICLRRFQNGFYRSLIGLKRSCKGLLGLACFAGLSKGFM